MEQLSSLEDDLPPAHPPTSQEIQRLNQEVTQEFKIAANAVSQLYRLSSTRSTLNKHVGYVTCLEDVMKQLEAGKSVEQLQQWCIKRRQDLLGEETVAKTWKQKENTASEIPTFRLSKPALSVDHSSHFQDRRIIKPQLTEKFLQQRRDTTNQHPSANSKIDNKTKKPKIK